jgi:hypothetical protein
LPSERRSAPRRWVGCHSWERFYRRRCPPWRWRQPQQGCFQRLHWDATVRGPKRKSFRARPAKRNERIYNGGNLREHDSENSDRLFKPVPDDGPSLRWLKAHAQYLRVHMSGRVLVSVWLPRDRRLHVHQVLALRDGSVVLQGALEDGTELQVTRSTESLSLEMQSAPEGKMCTGFAFIGVSRTPQPFLDRTKSIPSPPPHEGQDDDLPAPTPPHEAPGHGGHQ